MSAMAINQTQGRWKSDQWPEPGVKRTRRGQGCSPDDNRRVHFVETGSAVDFEGAAGNVGEVEASQESLEHKCGWKIQEILEVCASAERSARKCNAASKLLVETISGD
jgi:hypothetical protein